MIDGQGWLNVHAKTMKLVLAASPNARSVPVKSATTKRSLHTNLGSEQNVNVLMSSCRMLACGARETLQPHQKLYWHAERISKIPLQEGCMGGHVRVSGWKPLRPPHEEKRRKRSKSLNGFYWGQFTRIAAFPPRVEGRTVSRKTQHSATTFEDSFSSLCQGNCTHFSS